MGELVNFLSGMGKGVLPVSNIGGILFNTPEILKLTSIEKRTKEIIKRAKPKYIMVDSGGYQAFQVKEANRDAKSRKEQTLLIMNDSKPIYSKQLFNLTATHVLEAVKKIEPDFVVAPDIPVPKPEHPDQKRHLFLESLGYSEYCARELSKMLAGNPKTKLLIPLQLYDLFEYDYFLDHIKDVRFAGVSIPRRVMTNTKLVIFMLKAHSIGIDYVHLLGSSRFAHIVILAYMATHFINFVSFDSTNLIRFSTKNQYLQPYGLDTLDLRLNSEEDLTVPIQCSCPWCSDYKSFFEIQHEATDEKVSFLVNHNFFVIEELMRVAMENAESAASLADFLHKKTSRKKDIQEIKNIFTFIESLGSASVRADVLETLFNKFCRS